VDTRGVSAGVGLERYEEAFRENDIEVEILPKLTADKLKVIGAPPSGIVASSSKRFPP
jgi:SAM domain (Sterile alpha motif)